MRDDSTRMVNVLSEFKASDNLLLTIRGPPGIGKTKETVVWLLQELMRGDEGKVCAWVQLRPFRASEGIVYLMRKQQGTIKYDVIQSTHLFDDLNAWAPDLVVFDEIVQDNMAIMSYAYSTLNLKTIALSSAPFKSDSNFPRKKFIQLNGWKLSEYLEACKDDTFYEVAKDNLRTEGFSEEDMNDPSKREQIVTAKHHIAGACAHWMFDLSADQLLSREDDVGIDSQLSQMDHAELMGVREYFCDIFPSLIHVISRIDNLNVIVSQHAANKLRKIYGSEFKSTLHAAG